MSKFALTRVRQELEKRGDRFITTNPFQKFRFGHFYIVTKNLCRYYIIFKEDYYRSFGNQFENKEGYGESINEEALQRCLEKRVALILFCHPDGKIYSISPKKMKYNSYFRLQNNEKESTYSIKIKELDRWDE